jgi:hypothetical protein
MKRTRQLGWLRVLQFRQPVEGPEEAPFSRTNRLVATRPLPNGTTHKKPAMTLMTDQLPEIGVHHVYFLASLDAQAGIKAESAIL